MSSEHPHDFASDNHAGAHPEILEAIAAANDGHAGSYGADPGPQRAERALPRHFGDDARAFPVFNGTGANVAAIDALTAPPRGGDLHRHRPHARRRVRRARAPRRHQAAHRRPPSTASSPPTTSRRWEAKRGDEHHVQPRVVSITQATELGHRLHARGDPATRRRRPLARDAPPRRRRPPRQRRRRARRARSRELTTDAGVDVVSFGGTKNGLLFGEAVVFLRPRARRAASSSPASSSGSSPRRCASSPPSSRRCSRDDLWLRNASHANEMAARLAAAVAGARRRRDRLPGRGQRRLRPPARAPRSTVC